MANLTVPEVDFVIEEHVHPPDSDGGILTRDSHRAPRSAEETRSSVGGLLIPSAVGGDKGFERYVVVLEIPRKVGSPIVAEPEQTGTDLRPIGGFIVDEGFRIEETVVVQHIHEFDVVAKIFRALRIVNRAVIGDRQKTVGTKNPERLL